MRSINTNYIPELDHLRCFAALMILIFHVANGALVHYLHFDTGVPLFFTLSGFLFFLIASNKQSEIMYWKFIYNRFLRIYPLIIFLFFIAIVIMKKFTALDFINLFGLNLPGTGKTSWIAGDWGYQYLSFNWWTIGVEFVFYLLFPFLYKFYLKYGIKFLLASVLLIVVFRYGFYYSLLGQYGWKNLAIDLNYSVFGNFDIFIVGMIAGHFLKRLPSNSLIHALASSKLFFCFYLVFMWWFLIKYINLFDSSSYPVIIGILCSILIITYMLAFSNSRSTRYSKVLSILGSMSFSIYLLHGFVKDSLVGIGLTNYMNKLLINTFHLPHAVIIFVICFLLYIPATLIISSLTFNVIEKPFLEMRQRYFK